MARPKPQAKPGGSKSKKKGEAAPVEMDVGTDWGFDNEDNLHVLGTAQGARYENLGRIVKFKRGAVWFPTGAAITLVTLTGNTLVFASESFKPYLWVINGGRDPHEDCIREQFHEAFNSRVFRNGGQAILTGHTLGWVKNSDDQYANACVVSLVIAGIAVLSCVLAHV